MPKDSDPYIWSSKNKKKIKEKILQSNNVASTDSNFSVDFMPLVNEDDNLEVEAWEPFCGEPIKEQQSTKAPEQQLPIEPEHLIQPTNELFDEDPFGDVIHDLWGDQEDCFTFLC